MEKEKQRISLLPDDIAINTMKATLDENPIETARAILYVAIGGQVFEHTHDTDSEIYLIIEPNEDRSDFTVDVRNVVGNNSPTSQKSHSIEQSEQPRIAITTKRSQADKLWDYDWKKYSQNGKGFLEALGFQIQLSDSFLKITSTVPDHKPEIVTIYDKIGMITYSSSYGIEQIRKLDTPKSTGLPIEAR